MRSQFRDFPAYRASTAVANDLHRVIAGWSAFDRWSVGLQLIRAADSIGANVAEASGRWQPADKKRLLVIARGSAYETEHWLSCAAERDLLDDWTDRLDPVMRGLGGLITDLRRR